MMRYHLVEYKRFDQNQNCFDYNVTCLTTKIVTLNISGEVLFCVGGASSGFCLIILKQVPVTVLQIVLYENNTGSLKR